MIDINHLNIEALVALNDRVIERIKFLEHARAHMSMMAFNIGASVSFETAEGRQFGRLVKYNRKTVTRNRGYLKMVVGGESHLIYCQKLKKSCLSQNLPTRKTSKSGNDVREKSVNAIAAYFGRLRGNRVNADISNSEKTILESR
jgi:hypothetical protein